MMIARVVFFGSFLFFFLLFIINIFFIINIDFFCLDVFFTVSSQYSWDVLVFESGWCLIEKLI